jgi:hypothetical protein
MNKKAILQLLAAASFTAACTGASSDDIGESSDALTSFPFPVPEQRGCISKGKISEGTLAGNYVRVRFFSGPPDNGRSLQLADVEVYDAHTGYLVDNFRYQAKKLPTGELILFESGSGSSNSSIATLAVSGAVTTLTVRNEILRGYIGKQVIAVTCDLAPGAAALDNPVAPPAVAADPIGASTVLAEMPDGGSCPGVGLIPSGIHAGMRMRVRFEYYMIFERRDAIRARIEIYDPSTDLVVEEYNYLAKLNRAGVYAIYDTASGSSSVTVATIAPTVVAGQRVLAFQGTRAEITKKIGGVVPVDCDFVR